MEFPVVFSARFCCFRNGARTSFQSIYCMKYSEFLAF